MLGDFLEELGVAKAQSVAVTLLRDFGSISAILAASWWRLRRSVGFEVAGAIRASRNLMRAALAENLARGPLVTSRKDLLDLLKFELGGLKQECVIAIYLDCQSHLLSFDRVAEGTGATCPVPLSKIVHRGLDVGAAAILVVHNHPSGDPTPSEADRRAMAKLSWIASDLDMTLLDALVVAGDSVCSILR